MPKLKQIKPKELLKILEKNGFVSLRQKGSHLMMFNKEKNKFVTVPLHNKPLKKGTLAAILRQSQVRLN